jgi:hypothetical protein
MEASRKHNDGTQGHSFIPSIHNTLHASVLYSGFLLQAILGHIFFAEQLGNALCNSIIDSQTNTPDKKILFCRLTYLNILSR